MNLASPGLTPKLALDETSFQQLLAAAYVVQQHNDLVRTKGLQPDATALSETKSVPAAGSKTPSLPVLSEPNSEALPSHCRVCGRPFGADESFCGSCSMPRVAGAPSENLQGKWASLWYMQRAQATKSEVQSSSESQSNITAHQFPPQIRQGLDPEVPVKEEPPALDTQREALRDAEAPRDLAPTQNLSTSRRSVFEAQRAQPKLYPLDEEPFIPIGLRREPTVQADLLQRAWQAVWLPVRGRYLTWAVSATGLVLVLLVLALWPSSKNPQLTWVQSVLVELGLADVPQPPQVVKSNPDAKVWVDVHTGLYYCEGSGLYGKTTGGHLATQREALQESFESAERVPCP